jgi:DNA-binding NarL/FixJ family response regulator
MAAIRVLIVDDSPQFLKVARMMLSEDPDLEVVGGTCSGADAVDLVSRLHPDVVLMDLAMPLMNGLEATRHIKTWPQAPIVIIVTLYDNTEYRNTASAAGADGFLLKSEAATQLQPLIHSLVQERQARAQ